MALSFPTNPQVGDIYTSGSISYQWDGQRWVTTNQSLDLTSQALIDIAIAYGQSNTAYSISNTAYDVSNGVSSNLTSSWRTSNTAYTTANISFNTANGAYGVANVANTTAANVQLRRVSTVAALKNIAVQNNMSI